ncbi:hypothetical protein F4777DRAFT_567498 [Nemania sp. FL0916]|nr:hypothetical protein F4777DRAFT_567498 [Nemania sp. FL0916]
MENPSATNRGSSTIASGSIELPNTVTREDIDRKPWKYVGYCGYTRLIASEDDFFILRRFNALSIRIALLLQDEIASLKDELADMDETTSRKGSQDVHNGSFRQDLDERNMKLNEIRQRIVNYNKFVLQQAEMKKFQAPRRQVVRSLRIWHENHDNAAILPEERQYLDHKHESDLFSVVQRDKTPLRRFIDNSRWLRTLAIWRLKKQDTVEIEPEVELYSEKRMNTFASSVIVAFGAILLLAPLWILFALQSPALKLAVITIFITTFLVVLSFAMVTKPFEALGATAAYAAVLMVFLQFGSGSS